MNQFDRRVMQIFVRDWIISRSASLLLGQQLEVSLVVVKVRSHNVMRREIPEIWSTTFVRLVICWSRPFVDLFHCSATVCLRNVVRVQRELEVGPERRWHRRVDILCPPLLPIWLQGLVRRPPVYTFHKSLKNRTRHRCMCPNTHSGWRVSHRSWPSSWSSICYHLWLYTHFAMQVSNNFYEFPSLYLWF